METFDKLLWTLFKVRPAEKRRTMLMALYLLAAVSSFIMGRIIRDALFLSRFDRSMLVYNYVTVAFSVALPAYIYTKFADRYRRDRLIMVVLAGLMASLLVARLLAETEAPWFYFALYNWIEVFGAFLMIQFWTFASDVFSSREAKRLFPFIGGGGVLANIVCGVAVAALVKVMGTENLLVVQAALLTICIYCVWQVGKEQRERLQEAVANRRAGAQVKSEKTLAGNMQAVFKSKHLQIVAAMTCITFITVQFIDFSFKTVTREYYQGDQLSTFFAYFFSISGVVAALIQFLITRRILERYGVVVALIILPIALTGGSLVSALTIAGLWAATITKGAENTLRYSLYDATMQLLYAAVPSDIRGRAKAFIDGILKPISIGLAGGLLLLLVVRMGVGIELLYWVAMGFLVVWIGLVLTIKREYVRQLMATLRKRRLNFETSTLEITDARTIDVLSKTLQSSNVHEVLSALELVPRVKGGDLIHEVAQLCSHPNTDIRLTALRIIGRGDAESVVYLDLVYDRFRDSNQEVRAEAIRSFCAIARERAIPTVREYLHDPSALVRASSVAGLMRHGGLDGILSCAEQFKAMLSSEEASVRAQAAWVLGEIRVRNFFQPALELMQDKDVAVQNAAIAAAGKMQSPELIPVLVYKLARRETARPAQLALVSYGEVAVPVLAKVLAHEAEEIAIRRHVPRALATIGSKNCLEILVSNLNVRDPGLRWEVARAAARLHERLTGTPIDYSRVKPHLLNEVRDYYQNLAALSDTGGLDVPSGYDLLSDAIRERVDGSLDRIFRFLGILYPLRTIDLVFRNLHSQSPVVRANAIEILDNLLEKDISRLLLPILDDGSVEQKIQFGESAFKIARRQRNEWMGQFLSDDDPWLRVCALYDIGETGLREFIPQVSQGLADPDPLIRETAVRTLSVLLDNNQFVNKCQVLLSDEDNNVRRYAESLLNLARATA